MTRSTGFNKNTIDSGLTQIKKKIKINSTKYDSIGSLKYGLIFKMILNEVKSTNTETHQVEKHSSSLTIDY